LPLAACRLPLAACRLPHAACRMAQWMAARAANAAVLAQAQVLCGGEGFGYRSGCHADSHIGLSIAQRTDAVK